MFSFCTIKEKVCGFCGEYRGELFCGIEKKDNKIINMIKCPYKPRKR
jgi:hypothetical protein